MQSIAQSGGRWIAVSVKTLADFFYCRTPAGVEIQPVRSELSFGRLTDAHFCREKPTSNHGALRFGKLNEKENKPAINTYRRGGPTLVAREEMQA
jgi:hypothetical protein